MSMDKVHGKGLTMRQRIRAGRDMYERECADTARILDLVLNPPKRKRRTKKNP